MDALPDELILTIFLNICGPSCVRDIANLAKCSKRLYEIANDTKIWGHMTRQKYGVVDLNHIPALEKDTSITQRQIKQKFKE